MTQHVAHRKSDEIHELRAEIERLTHELDKAHRLLSQSIGWQRDAEIAKAKKDVLIERLRALVLREEEAVAPKDGGPF